MAGFGSVSSIWFKIERMNTAVFPIPDTAWHKISSPDTAAGMHFYWTSDGCSNPHSVMALESSLLSKKSLKLVV